MHVFSLYTLRANGIYILENKNNKKLDPKVANFVIQVYRSSSEETVSNTPFSLLVCCSHCIATFFFSFFLFRWLFRAICYCIWSSVLGSSASISSEQIEGARFSKSAWSPRRQNEQSEKTKLLIFSEYGEIQAQKQADECRSQVC